MNNEEILKKAIEKAIENGYVYPGFAFGLSGNVYTGFNLDGGIMYKYKPVENMDVYNNEVDCESVYDIIFSHDFAKAFWGEEDIKKEYDEGVDNLEFGGILHYPYVEGACITWKGKKWQFHLQQMALEKEPLEYLEKFIIND